MAAETEQFVPFRVAAESYGRSPRPRDASLSREAARVVAQVFVKQGLVDAQGKPLEPAQFRAVSRHRPGAGNSYDIGGVLCVYPTIPGIEDPDEYWLFPKSQFDSARILNPYALAEACVDSLRRAFTGTKYWSDTCLRFRSVFPSVEYGELVADTAEVASARQPELPVSVGNYAAFAANVGGVLLNRITDNVDLGRASLAPDVKVFVPKGQIMLPVPAPG